MLYVLCALKPEAQAFVDKFQLSKDKKNKDLTLIISGIGKEKMFQATKKVVKMMKENDRILNIGICGADDNYKIGQLIDGFDESLICVDAEVSGSQFYKIVDMESDGFKEATSDVKNRYIFKVVSDHFEPQNITKELTKKLIFEKIDEIMERAYA